MGLANLRALVTGVNAEGRAVEAVLRFDRPLEDPSLLLFSWHGAGLVPYSPPAVGAAYTLCEIDLGAAVRRP